MQAKNETRGFWLGLLGVICFAGGTPMLRLAVGSAAEPQLTPEFVAAGRASFAGIASILYLWLSAAAPLRRRDIPALAVSALGNVVGFPLFASIALRHLTAMHAAVVSGLMPLATAVVAALYFRQRASFGFWACATLGCATVLAFASVAGAGAISPADGLLLLAVLSTAIGYVAGAKVSSSLPAEHVICWVLVISLPLTIPVTLLSWPPGPVRASAWIGLAYNSLFAMWLGYVAWYRGLSIGGTVRVSQVQLVQPFLSILMAVPLLGERLDMTTVVFSVVVVIIAFVGKRMPVGVNNRARRPAVGAAGSRE